MKTKLGGTIISDYKVNEQLVFIDMSVYNTMLPIEEPALGIIVPYALEPVVVEFTPKNITLIDTKALGLSTTIEEIPCGLYKFTQTICPSDKLRYEFWYVHTAAFERKAAELYCEGKYDEAQNIVAKVDALKGLVYCMTKESESKIKAIIESIDCVSCFKYTECEVKTNTPVLPLKRGLKSTNCSNC